MHVVEQLGKLRAMLPAGMQPDGTVVEAGKLRQYLLGEGLGW
jgi:hypothetical protein